MEPDKKISFGFNKSTKKQNVFQAPSSKKYNVQLIDCLEGQTIKLKGKVDKAKGPLVIPMVQSKINILDRRRAVKVKHEVDERPDSELTVDELAARELIREAQTANVDNKNAKVFALPLVGDNVEIEDKAEPTFDDYESVPITDYGLAMLRGMGWSEGCGIGKNKAAIKMVEPELRPKGMGLGANKGTNQPVIKKAVDQNGKELVLVKGACAKITNGKHEGSYCEVQGFDDESGRIIVKTSIHGLILSLNEFLVVPVTNEEYLKSSKVINTVKYEEYKNKTEEADNNGKRMSSEESNNEEKSERKREKLKSLKKYSSDQSDEDNLKQKQHKSGRSSKYNRNESRDRDKSRQREHKNKSYKRYSSEESDDDYKHGRNESDKSKRKSNKSSSDYKYKSKKSDKYKYRSDSDSDNKHKHKKDKHKGSSRSRR